MENGSDSLHIVTQHMQIARMCTNLGLAYHADCNSCVKRWSVVTSLQVHVMTLAYSSK